MSEQRLIAEDGDRGKPVANAVDGLSTVPSGEVRDGPSAEPPRDVRGAVTLVPSWWAVVLRNFLLAWVGIEVGGVVGANAGATDLNLRPSEKRQAFELLLIAGGLAGGLGLPLAGAQRWRQGLLMLVGGAIVGTGTAAFVGAFWWEWPWPPGLAVGLTLWGAALGAGLGRSRGQAKAGALIGLLLFGAVSSAGLMMGHPDPAGLFGVLLGLLGSTLLWWRRSNGRLLARVRLGIACLVVLAAVGLVSVRNRFWPATLRCGPARGDFYNPRGAVDRVVFSPDGQQVLASHHTGLELWDADTGRLLASFPMDKGHIAAVGYSADGTPLCVTLTRDLAQQWDVRNGALLREVQMFKVIPPEQIDNDVWRPRVALAADGGSALYAMPGEKWLRVLDFVAGGEVIVPLPGVPPVWAVAWDADRRLAVLSCRDKTIRLWDLGKKGVPRELFVSPELEDFFDQVTLSTDGRRGLAARHIGGSLVVWDVPRWDNFRWLGRRRRGGHAAFSPDGERLLAVGDSGRVTLWDAESGKLLRRPLNHRYFLLVTVWRTPEDIVFSPDGRRAATVCRDGSVRVWDLGD
ncbi:MAG: hypothetical protein HYS12_06960 [Planctomycetes bacterium]|nr:hypothetical protein [Planctomycetota bacterium]